MLQVQEAVDGAAASAAGRGSRRGTGTPSGGAHRPGWDVALGAPPGTPGSSPPPTHTWSGRPGRGNFQVALGTLDSARKSMWQTEDTGGNDTSPKARGCQPNRQAGPSPQPPPELGPPGAS